MLTIIVITCVIFQTAVAAYLLNINKVEDDFEKNMQKLLFVLLVHLCTKFFLIAIIHNAFIYGKLASGFGLSYGPMLLVTTMAFLKKPMKRLHIYLHLLPFAFFSIVYLILVAGGLTQHIHPIFIVNYTKYYVLLILISLIFYPCMVKYQLQLCPAEKKTLEGRLINNIASLLLVATIACVIIFEYIDLIYRQSSHVHDIRLFTYTSFALIPVLMLRYKLQKKAEEKMVREEEEIQIITTAVVINQPDTEKRYQKSALDASMLDEYENILTKFMEQHKIYLDAELSLEELAQKVKIPKHHLTQLLNDRLKKNFYKFINEYRINEAINKLKDPTNEVNILSLAYDCGFNSKSSFNSYFKQLTGYTPSGYRKMVTNTPAAEGPLSL
ncbi:helix-turn-helix domain-containing protein [Russula earlei]|uniref:Helix-turn-helix domain-containing protein n=1 Tax=Russula earlei TaxID=71964 RepID=A0ACC0TU00_9AGAM|nr:helix-turn-helix domain-containing protein [Russula earlei]